jgi:hypothetical protein
MSFPIPCGCDYYDPNSKCSRSVLTHAHSYAIIINRCELQIPDGLQAEGKTIVRNHQAGTSSLVWTTLWPTYDVHPFVETIDKCWRAYEWADEDYAHIYHVLSISKCLTCWRQGTHARRHPREAIIGRSKIELAVTMFTTFSFTSPTITIALACCPDTAAFEPVRRHLCKRVLPETAIVLFRRAERGILETYLYVPGGTCECPEQCRRPYRRHAFRDWNGDTRVVAEAVLTFIEDTPELSAIFLCREQALAGVSMPPPPQPKRACTEDIRSGSPNPDQFMGFPWTDVEESSTP